MRLHISGPEASLEACGRLAVTKRATAQEQTCCLPSREGANQYFLKPILFITKVFLASLLFATLRLFNSPFEHLLQKPLVYCTFWWSLHHHPSSSLHTTVGCWVPLPIPFCSIFPLPTVQIWPHTWPREQLLSILPGPCPRLCLP